MKTYKDIKDGEAFIIVFSNIEAMLFGINSIEQDNKGSITVNGANGNQWRLGTVNDSSGPLDIVGAYNQGAGRYVVSRLMPMCSGRNRS